MRSARAAAVATLLAAGACRPAAPVRRAPGPEARLDSALAARLCVAGDSAAAQERAGCEVRDQSVPPPARPRP